MAFSVRFFRKGRVRRHVLSLKTENRKPKTENIRYKSPFDFSAATSSGTSFTINPRERFGGGA